MKDVPEADVDALVHDYLRGDLETVPFVEECLREIGHSPSILGAMSRAQQAVVIEAIERSNQVTRKASSRMLEDLLKARRVEQVRAGRSKSGRGLPSSGDDDAAA